MNQDMQKQKDNIFIPKPDKVFSQYILKCGFKKINEFTFREYRLLFLKITDHFLRQQITVRDFYEYVSQLAVSSEIDADSSLRELQELISEISASESFAVVQSHRPTLELVHSTELLKKDYPYDNSMLKVMKYYKKNFPILFTRPHTDTTERSQDISLNSSRQLRRYASKFSIDTASKLSFQQFRFLFLRLIDDYLQGLISLDEFLNFISTLEFSSHEEKLGEDLTDLQPDEVIEYISDLSSHDEIREHPPTLVLVEQTELEPENYPYDWPMREALRYYKKYRHLLTDSRV